MAVRILNTNFVINSKSKDKINLSWDFPVKFSSAGDHRTFIEIMDQVLEELGFCAHSRAKLLSVLSEMFQSCLKYPHLSSSLRLRYSLDFEHSRLILSFLITIVFEDFSNFELALTDFIEKKKWFLSLMPSIEIFSAPNDREIRFILSMKDETPLNIPTCKDLDRISQQLERIKRNHLIRQPKTQLINKVIDKERQLEETVKELRQRTVELQRLLDETQTLLMEREQFFANVSHDLRTPLTAIIGYCQLLEEEILGGLNKDQRDVVKLLRKNAETLLELVNNLLELSKLEVGRERLNISVVNMEELVNDTVRQLSMIFQEKNLQVTIKKSIENVELEGDQSKLKRVLMNLLSNAAKYSRNHGKIVISIGGTNDKIWVSITDEGIGIRKEDQERIFEGYWRAHLGEKIVNGVGLGLSISRRFVEFHGGSLSVRSELGKGSTFTITLPRKMKHL